MSVDENMENIVTIESTSEECHAQLGQYLTSEYEILRRVFSYLALDDLDNVGKVCTAWVSAAQVTKRERKLIQTFVLSELKYKMGTIWSEADFCVSFCTAPNKTFENKVSKYVNPEGEFLVCLSRTGVIGTTSNLSQIIHQKVRVGLPLAPKKFYMTCLRLPKLPDVGMSTFLWEESVDFKEFRNNFTLPKNHIVKCLLILMIVEESRSATMQKDDFLKFLKSKQKESFAVGGCVIDNVINYTRGNVNNSVVKYIVFHGKNVNAAATVLTSNIKTMALVDNKVEELKKNCPVSNSGVLFVFRCAGRQRVVRRYNPQHDISKWEGEALTKHFPNTPTVGCFGYGEFGNEFPCVNSVSPNKRFRGSETCDYSYSTSLVYLGFTH